jgi:hypothetical protein
MKSAFQKKFLHVKGNALKKKDQWLYYDMDTMIDAVRLHLKMLGMLRIKELQADTLHFTGREWQENLFSNFPSFEKFIGEGQVQINLEGPQLVAKYTVRPSGLSLVASLAFIGFYLLIMVLNAGTDVNFINVLAALSGLLVVGLLFFGLSCFFIHRGMKQELKQSFETAEKVIESKTRNYDTSLVEPGHLKMNVENLARSAYFYRDQGMKEKSRSYFALILDRYPWTEEATAAFHELRKN